MIFPYKVVRLALMNHEYVLAKIWVSTADNQTLLGSGTFGKLEI